MKSGSACVVYMQRSERAKLTTKRFDWNEIVCILIVLLIQNQPRYFGLPCTYWGPQRLSAQENVYHASISKECHDEEHSKKESEGIFDERVLGWIVAPMFVHNFSQFIGKIIQLCGTCVSHCKRKFWILWIDELIHNELSKLAEQTWTFHWHLNWHLSDLTSFKIEYDFVVTFSGFFKF